MPDMKSTFKSKNNDSGGNSYKLTPNEVNAIAYAIQYTSEHDDDHVRGSDDDAVRLTKLFKDVLETLGNDVDDNFLDLVGPAEEESGPFKK